MSRSPLTAKPSSHRKHEVYTVHIQHICTIAGCCLRTCMWIGFLCLQARKNGAVWSHHIHRHKPWAGCIPLPLPCMHWERRVQGSREKQRSSQPGKRERRAGMAGLFPLRWDAPSCPTPSSSSHWRRWQTSVLSGSLTPNHFSLLFGSLFGFLFYCWGTSDLEMSHDLAKDALLTQVGA